MEVGSVKLTNFSREAIAKRAVEHSFAAREEAMASESDALAREAYDTLFPLAEQKLVAKIPENWVRLDQCLQFNVGGQAIRLDVKGPGLPVPYKSKTGDSLGYGCNRLGVIEPGDLCDRIQAHALAKHKLTEEKRAALRATQSMLEAVTTVGKLAEVWPEGKDFYIQYVDRPAPQLPAVRVQEINQLLGLAEAA